MAKLNKSFTPNVIFDFGDGFVKTNRLSENFTEFLVTTDNNDPVFVQPSDDEDVFVKTDLFCPVNAMEIDFNQGTNIKVDPTNIWDWQAFEEENEAWGASKIAYCQEEVEHEGLIDQFLYLSGFDYRPAIVCLPSFAPIRKKNGEVIVEPRKFLIDGTKATILVKTNPTFSKEMQDLIGGEKVVEGYVANSISNKALILCADARIFNPYAYCYEKVEEYGELGGRGYYAPEGYKDGIDDITDNGNIDDSKLPYARKNFFVVNGEYTRFLIVSPGHVVKLTSYTEKVKTKGGEEEVLLWNVDNSTAFTKADGYVYVGGLQAYDHEYGILRYCTFGNYSSFGGVYDGTKTTNKLFMSKDLKKAFDSMKIAEVGYEKYFEVYISLLSAEKSHWQDSIRNISIKMLH